MADIADTELKLFRAEEQSNFQQNKSILRIDGFVWK